MKGYRCLDCGYLHAGAGRPVECAICVTGTLVLSTRGTLDGVWAEHMQGFSSQNDIARLAWAKAVSDFVMEAAMARVLQVFEGYFHETAVSRRWENQEVCFWG